MVPILTPKIIAPGTTAKRFYFDGTAADAWATDNTVFVVRSQVVVGGRPAMRITIDTNETGTYFTVSQAISPAVDLSNVHGYLRMRMPTSLPAYIVSVGYHSTDGTTVSCSIWHDQTSYKLNDDGWVTIPINSAILLTATNSTLARLATVDKLYITVNWPTAMQGSEGIICDLAELHLFAAPAQGKILLRMDDGYATQFALAEMLIARGIRPHLAIIPRLLGSSASYMTEAQALALEASGAILLNHYHNIGGTTYVSATADGWVTTNGGGAQTVAAKRADYASAVALMTAGGYDRWGRYTVVPGGNEGTGDAALIDEGVVDALWYALAGSTFESIPGAGGVGIVQGYNWPLTPQQARYMTTCALWDSKSVADMTADVDRCIAGKTFYPIHCHQPDAEDFEEVADHIAAAVTAGTLEVVTLEDIWGIAAHPDYLMASQSGNIPAGSVVDDDGAGTAAGGTYPTTATTQAAERGRRNRSHLEHIFGG